MKTENKEHTFVVCAYGESPYLEKCIDSLEKQTVKSRILIATSTPNPYIEKIAAVHNLEIRINTGEKGIAGDWNFAYGCADTPYVTLAHQDDVYREEYTEKVVTNLNSCEAPLIAFTDYYEIRDNKTVKENRLLHIKRGMLFPLKWRGFWRSRFVRRRILSIGSAICCPSVTLVKNNINEERVFENNMKSNIDWQAWEMLSKKEGEFVYVDVPLMCHRIHPGATTAHMLKNDERKAEDLFMFCKFWPKPVAKVIELFYQKAEKLYFPN
ncbi:Glycosyl transferase family 2 [uncultured Clostridium sp.]|nr:Glycosyl transferase family 2 [uncultured Clostridium sp.]